MKTIDDFTSGLKTAADVEEFINLFPGVKYTNVKAVTPYRGAKVIVNIFVPFIYKIFYSNKLKSMLDGLINNRKIIGTKLEIIIKTKGIF